MTRKAIAILHPCQQMKKAMSVTSHPRRRHTVVRRATEEAPLDRTMILVGAEAYRRFLARLNAAPNPNARLRKTLRKPAPWL